MLAATKVKMSGSEKIITKKNTFNISSIKSGSFWKFHDEVVQNSGKEMYIKSVLHVQSGFLLIRADFFLSVFAAVAA